MIELPENVVAYPVGTTYNRIKKVVRLLLYEPESQKLYYYDDQTGHKPYCLTNLTISELKRIERIRKHSSLLRFEEIKKYDALHDKEILVTKVIMKDPLAIGGKRDSIREIVPAESNGKVWEARISYDACYNYDNQIDLGMPYKVVNGKLIKVVYQEQEDSIKEICQKIGVKDDRWVRLFEYPTPDFLRVALDIEVQGESRTRVPDSKKAEYPVISCCLIGSDGKRTVLVLLREGVEVGEEILPEGTTMQFFGKELNLIRAIFASFKRYPFVITFNGDMFDLSYLYHRAINLGIKKENVPIQLSYRRARIEGCIHIDLYRFFFNKSLRNYAFQAKYKDTKLDAIAKALLGVGKLHQDENIWLATEMPKWSYSQLAKYNCQDGDITLELTTYNNGLVIKLMMAIMRISTMPLEEVNRFPISQWIRSMLFGEHRRRNYLIPNKEDIAESPLKGKIATKAVIKGKKYKGAIVVQPITGIHFNVGVIDFASLYPTVIKVKNMGYATVNCPHKECEDNKVPETTHWMCKKYQSMESEIIGLLRDLRVDYYKTLRKQNEWYSVVEQAIKVFLNASYGVFGNVDFALYCPPVSESITAFGRHSIKETIKKAQEIGADILYGDTDSVFLKNPTKEQIDSLIEWSTRVLDLDLELDKEYRYVCMSSRKKNYVGITPDGNYDIKGMTGKKKHVPIIIKDTFDVTMKYLANAKSIEEVETIKEALKKVIKKVYFRLKRRDFELEEVAFRMTLGKSPDAYEKGVPQHARAAKMLESKGIFLKKGDSVSFVKVMGDPNVKPLQMATKEDVDVNKYHEMLQSTFEQLLDSFDIDFEEIIGVTRLERFM